MRRSITSYYGCLDGTAQELCGSASPELHFFPSSEQSSTAGKVAGPVPQRRYAPRDLAIPWLIYVGILCWLVVSTPRKNISQLGLLFPIYGKTHVPNHQPVYTIIYYYILLYTIYTYSDPEL